jgi:hypothetical protein
MNHSGARPCFRPAPLHSVPVVNRHKVAPQFFLFRRRRQTQNQTHERATYDVLCLLVRRIPS